MNHFKAVSTNTVNEKPVLLKWKHTVYCFYIPSQRFFTISVVQVMGHSGGGQSFVMIYIGLILLSLKPACEQVRVCVGFLYPPYTNNYRTFTYGKCQVVNQPVMHVLAMSGGSARVRHLNSPLLADVLNRCTVSTLNPSIHQSLTGTRIIYDRKFLLDCRNSPLARTPPCCLPQIPGVTCPATHPGSKLQDVKEEVEEEEKDVAGNFCTSNELFGD